jgi:1,4-dihydroxy-6-naphthoate synthase
MKYGRGIEESTNDRFVGMYVNDFTVDMGRKGKDGLMTLHKAAVQAGLLKKPAAIEFVKM